ncbi:unnamed protein product [Alopecurus aequalis]
MVSAANSAGTVAFLLVLLVGAMASTAEAARISALGAGSIAAAPAASVHTSSFVGCMARCSMDLIPCNIKCASKPVMEAPVCVVACVQTHIECAFRCGAPAAAPPPQAA